MRRSILIVICLCAVVSSKLTAQTDVQLSQYWAIPGLLNPATVGKDDKINVAAMNRMQWVGVTNAPTTFLVNAETPFKLFKKEQGIGLILINDKAGLFSNTDFALQYSYRLKFAEKHKVNLGLRLGATTQGFMGTKVDIPSSDDHNSSDPSIPTTDVTAMAFDAGFGAYYMYEDYYLGLSVTHLTAPEIELDEKSYIKLERTYYLTGGCNINLQNPLFQLHPSFLFKTDFTFYQFDATLLASYNKMFFGGLSYRFKDAVIIALGAEIKGIRVGYSYDISTSAMASASGGSHEIYASYNIKLDLSGKSKNKHKSIRIL